MSAKAPAVLFAGIETASAAGEWVVLAADYGLGASFEVAARSPEGDRKSLRAWFFRSVPSARCAAGR